MSLGSKSGVRWVVGLVLVVLLATIGVLAYLVVSGGDEAQRRHEREIACLSAGGQWYTWWPPTRPVHYAIKSEANVTPEPWNPRPVPEGRCWPR
jgi:hypothetical protein